MRRTQQYLSSMTKINHSAGEMNIFGTNANACKGQASGIM